jgi:hypothetical protein
MSTHRAVFVRSAVGMVGFILYVSVGGAALTHALSRGVASQAVEAAGTTRSGSSAATVVIGMSVEDGLCDGYCESPSVLCTTTANRSSTDWIVVRHADFSRLYGELCEPQLE